jgi:hypothetical protein
MVASSSQRPLVSGIVQPFGSDEAIRRWVALGVPFAPRPVEGIIELVQQIPETVGNPLLDHIIVNSLEDVAQPSLVFAT